MPDVDMDKLEMERVLNLIQGFGWEKTEERISDEYIEITIRKKRTGPEVPPGAGPG